MQLPLVGATEGVLPLRVADIYQQFSSPAEGTVRNIIKLSVWPWLLVRPDTGSGALCPEPERWVLIMCRPTPMVGLRSTYSGRTF